MSQEKFSLKWNEFEKNILSTFKDLREEKELFDITLVSDEEYQVRKIYSDLIKTKKTCRFAAPIF